MAEDAMSGQLLLQECSGEEIDLFIEMASVEEEIHPVGRTHQGGI
jgi:hypothetical protein